MRDLPSGRYLFVELGRKKASFEVDIQSPYDMEKAISPHLMSHDVEWNYDPKTNTGFVFAGWHVVGSFNKVH